MTTPTDNEAASFIASIQQLRTRAEQAEHLASEHETRSRIAEERLADSERRLRMAETQRDAYMRFCVEIRTHQNNLQISLGEMSDAATRAARYMERTDPKLQDMSDEKDQRATEAIGKKFGAGLPANSQPDRPEPGSVLARD